MTVLANTAKHLTPFFMAAMLVAGCETATEESEPDFTAELQELVTGKLLSNGTLWLSRTPAAIEAVGLEVEGITQSGVRYVSLTEFESGATFFGIGFSSGKMAETSTVVHCSKNVNVPTGWIKFGRCVENVLNHCEGVWGRMNGNRFEVTGYNATYNDDGTILLTPCTIPDPHKG